MERRPRDRWRAGRRQGQDRARDRSPQGLSRQPGTSLRPEGTSWPSNDSTMPCCTCATPRRRPRSTRDVLGFQVVADMGDQACFLRADGSTTTTTSGLFSVGPRPAPAPHSLGLYHLAWQVHTIDELAAMRARLARGRRAGRRERPRREQEPLREGPRRHRVRGHVGRATRDVARPRRAPGGSTSTPTLARWPAVDTADQ